MYHMQFPLIDYLVQQKRLAEDLIDRFSGPTEDALLDELVAQGYLTEDEIRSARMLIAHETQDALPALRQASRDMSKVAAHSGEIGLDSFRASLVEEIS